MFIRLITAVSLIIVMTLSGQVWSYDNVMAQSYAQLFAPAHDAKTGKALHMMPPVVFVNHVKSGKALVTLDVRTPAESCIYSSTLPGSLAIPINDLFTKTSLDRIPTDKKVVVVCQSGTIAAAAGTSLRHIGFKNVYILKGGFKALTGYLGVKQANSPLKVMK